MRIVATSDIHYDFSLLNRLNKREGDLLIIAGDLTYNGEDWSMREVLNRIDRLRFKHKIVVLGNHDMEVSYEWCKENYPNIIFLNNEIVEIDNIKIYGTPYTKKFARWAYEYTDDVIDKTIPKEKVDIIVSHEPPSDYNLSLTERMMDIGNKELRKYVEDNEVLLFCGHCHECGGGEVKIKNSNCYNVAHKIMEGDYEDKIWKKK